MKILLYMLLFSFIINSDFENVQILEIESVKEMKKYMKSISKDLGGKCKDCHDMDDMSIDNPIKNKAREMMILTKEINDFLISINKKEDEKIEKVTCWTCHKGSFNVEHKR